MFDRAGRQHDLARAHLPQALARLPGQRMRQVIGEALIEADRVVREIAKCRRARQQPHARMPGERSYRPFKPDLGRDTLNER